MKSTTYFLKTIGTLALALSFSIAGHAQTAASGTANSAPATTAPSSNQGKASDKVDLKKLEDKYWAAKDEDYGVIQNRTFAKKGKLYASLVYGPLLNDPSAKGRAAGAMLGYFLNEDFGVEFSYLTYDSKKNDTVSAYENLLSTAARVSPDYNLLKATKTISVSYTPFYAKMAFMNMSIMYFDMGFTLGTGFSDYEIQKVTKDDNTKERTVANEKKSAPHFEIGVMQQLFLNQYFAFRLDIKNTFYSQVSQKSEISNTLSESQRPETTKSVNDTTITFGLTVFTK